MGRFLKSMFKFYTAPARKKVQSRFLAISYLVIIAVTWIAFLGSINLDLRPVYQKSCPVQGAASTKVKGYLSTEGLKGSDFQVENSYLYRRVWDNSDLILGNNAQDGGFIAVTNLIITPNQTRGFCVETNATVKCKSRYDCKAGETIPGTNSGALTGKCIAGRCQLSAWCPLEENKLPLADERPLLEGIQNYTVMLKLSVQFPACNEKKFRNILENATTSYLSGCQYNPENDTSCPIFRIGDIVKWSGENFSQVAITGGVFRIESIWNCDFDWGMSNCFPTYKFQKIDDSKAVLSPGLNFRIADYHEENRRTLTKVFGLKITILVSGDGNQFELLHFILSFGATIGIFSVGALICDTLLELIQYLQKYELCKRLIPPDSS
ncbi:P2X purinoceptor 4 [Folsomia candida]|uniref:P2X purinoceptor 4 n=1 Tax=Folsomia candida TaxID=158441 RepID=A0A226DI12_FOLCA|nr:P2X purinoceptor 4 [Folsomia candida]